MTKALLVPLVESLGIFSMNQLTSSNSISLITSFSICPPAPSHVEISLPGNGPVGVSLPNSQFLFILGNVLSSTKIQLPASNCPFSSILPTRSPGTGTEMGKSAEILELSDLLKTTD